MSRARRERRAALRDRTTVVAGGFQRAADRIAGVTASSRLGTVQVTLDQKGMVSTVVVGAEWRREAEPAALAALVLSTAAEAQVQRVNAWAENAEQELSEPTPAAPLAEVRDRARRLSGAAGDRFLDDAIEQVGGLRGAIDELTEEIEAVVAARHVGRSSGRHAAATVSGLSELLDLELDPRWLEQAHSFNIGREATEAVAEGLRTAARHSIDAVVARSRLGRLRELLVEPGPGTGRDGGPGTSERGSTP